MILADTSAWVEYDRVTGSAADERLTELIISGGPLAVTEPIVMEVLAGARDDQRDDDLRRLLLSSSCSSSTPLPTSTRRRASIANAVAPG